ncbi:ABC transporter ATP-binding protein [Candidatus Parvarchaeota archaeon]|jgi:multiple sugar transport system ATP-binding protein|nr:ABC transporter ATP-binding protein [Candidatus Parvarchaeota archaeon]
MVKVVLKDVYKSFKQKKKIVEVLKGVNLEVQDGKFTVILAPSGEGKTTLIRVIAGLERQEKGDVYIGDKLVNDTPPKDRNLAMVFQNYAIYPFMNVYDNIAFPLKLMRKNKDEIAKRVKDVAKMLEIDQLLDRKPNQLSGGQRQRVAIARALIKGTNLLLLDEPLSNLDAQLRTLARAQLKELQEKLKITIAYVTHDQTEAMVLADNVAILHNGKIEAFDSPLNVYRKPRDTWVAGFIGNPPMNLIDGELLDEKTFKFNGYKVKIPASVSKRLKVKKGPAILGIRPEDVKIGEGDIKGVIKFIEPLGSQTLLHLLIGKNELNVMVFQMHTIELNKEVDLNFYSDNLVFFDKKSGEIIEN